MWIVDSNSGRPGKKATDFPAVSSFTQTSAVSTATQLLPAPPLPLARPTFRALLTPYPPALYDTRQCRSPTPSPPSPRLDLLPEQQYRPELPTDTYTATAGAAVTACQPGESSEPFAPPGSYWSGQAIGPTYLDESQPTNSVTGTVQQQVVADLNELYRAGQRDLAPMSSSQIILPSPFAQFPMGMLHE